MKVDAVDASYPSLDDDESYKLRITGASATLKARTVWGALRGLETFSQLVTYEFDTATYEVVPCTIQDAPKYPHRGLMVDSGRHFLPVATLLHVVDALPYAKLNVLHWHLTDTQSFPVETPSRPSLWRGSFSKRERYSTEDVRRVWSTPPAGPPRRPGVRHARPRAGVYTRAPAPGRARRRSTCPRPDVRRAGRRPRRRREAVPRCLRAPRGDVVDTMLGSHAGRSSSGCKKNHTTADAHAYFVSRAPALARTRNDRSVGRGSSASSCHARRARLCTSGTVRKSNGGLGYHVDGVRRLPLV